MAVGKSHTYFAQYHVVVTTPAFDTNEIQREAPHLPRPSLSPSPLQALCSAKAVGGNAQGHHSSMSQPYLGSAWTQSNRGLTPRALPQKKHGKPASGKAQVLLPEWPAQLQGQWAYGSHGPPGACRSVPKEGGS